MPQKATRRQFKHHNTGLALRTTYHAGAISRADIARATTLTRPTVSLILSDLIGLNLVAEIGVVPSARGKSPTPARKPCSGAPEPWPATDCHGNGWCKG